MRRALKRWHVCGEEGSAIFETALALTILLTSMFGIIETGLMLYTYHFISEAAREGTRYAIVRGSSAGGPCSAYTSPPTCAVTKAQITTYVEKLGFPGIDPSKMMVKTTYASYPTGVTCTPSGACNNPGNQVTVAVTYDFPLNIPFVPAHTYTMTSTSAMIISQ
jgi:Flp pilus assembly protein TadG